MENTTKRYWKGIEEYRNDLEIVKNADREFNLDDLEGGTHRRDFLKMLGFGVAAVSLASCDAPVRKTIPYLKKPESIEPGIPNYFASSYVDGGDYCSILVKTHEGRPIKIEGNKLSPVSQGGVGARVHASLLGLYDIEKLKGPQKKGEDIKWESLDSEVKQGLSSASNIKLVSSTVISPSTKKVIGEFLAKYPSASQVVYDASSVSGLLEANAASFGKAVVPEYAFDKASVIVGVNCDFLGTWVAPEQFSKQWAAGRKLVSGKNGKHDMSRHYQFETGLTLTGANADYRGLMKPSEEAALLLALYNKLSGTSAGSSSYSSELLDKAVKDLKAAQGAALVVSGSNDAAVQTIVNAINSTLGSYGNTISFKRSLNYRQGSDADMEAFVSEVKAGKVDAVIFLNANPVYDFYMGTQLGEALSKVKTSVSFADRADETASLCGYIAPAPHFLESWGDAEPLTGSYSLMQPAISLIYNTRQAESSLLTWAGLDADYYKYLKSNWKSNILSNGGSWIQALHDGVFELPVAESFTEPTFAGDVASAASQSKSKAGEGLEISVFENISVGTGRHANNPWLQELPDPISKVTWENTLAISQKTANELGLEKGDWAKLSNGSYEIELPILIQPGQAHGTVSVAMGYGRTAAGKSGNVGVKALPFVGKLKWTTGGKLEKTQSGYTLAQTQTHETVMGRRAVVQESVLSEYVKNNKAGRFEPMVETSEGAVKPYSITLWNGHEKQNHSWGMVIDLNTCTGCAACLISCQAENNVPVVGKKEVVRAREMHWIRLDRYYSTDADTDYKIDPGYIKEMEIASENPEVVIQPMMCQHCSNATCETVCPVLATTHSSEGLNQMTYNRCVGTRYCANNCPYKVRRFNWWKYYENDQFDYNLNNELGRMVLNPDVTVRSRGVIEKCSMCVQRIQAGKLVAKKEKRRPVDGEIQTACSQSCPTGSIVFGDMLDPNSEISKTLEIEKEGRAFHVLEELNVRPQVSYLTKIRNKDIDDSKAPGIHSAEAHHEAAEEAHAEEEHHG
ncbi:TAT-variant-translocated molybdopterin oxidoreductase [Marinilongibacter aquaticus]|uniref:TAT-variant-translocated molybdopterin oxidoreductase n=1 Tax=Marinilongibacter aquaticus TaxID=2975157 RepID=UPI0021BD1814|nr:TAT-variant-translocated molybdopterin oxidoreductase [Marinilongibacter aquaticus]UBM57282.1 TAT-variant-translocated molybdopterin oxidoreductase [Marinilongibacter aquaticus]